MSVITNPHCFISSTEKGYWIKENKKGLYKNIKILLSFKSVIVHTYK